jgi:membrane protease YdiL (CAAX protease family)
MEELIFRAFFQERLSWFINIPMAIGISSAVFALLHYSKGSFSIVAFDIFTIFVDSIIYGVIYHRTKNIFASWIPHFLADIIGITLMISLFS